MTATPNTTKAGPSAMVTKQPEEMMPMASETQAEFMSRCQSDPGMMMEHPDDAERRDECQLMWDTGLMMMDAAKVPQQRARPTVYLDDRMEKRQRAGKPNSKIGLDGKRHSVRIGMKGYR